MLRCNKFSYSDVQPLRAITKYVPHQLRYNNVLKNCFLKSHREKANLAVTLVNASNDVMGHAAFFDYPNLSTVHQSKWEDWLHSKYDCDKCNVCIEI